MTSNRKWKRVKCSIETFFILQKNYFAMRLWVSEWRTNMYIQDVCFWKRWAGCLAYIISGISSQIWNSVSGLLGIKSKISGPSLPLIRVQIASPQNFGTWIREASKKSFWIKSAIFFAKNVTNLLKKTMSLPTDNIIWQDYDDLMT